MTPGNDACTNSTRRKKGVRTQSFAQTPRLNLFKNMRARGRMNTRGEYRGTKQVVQVCRKPWCPPVNLYPWRMVRMRREKVVVFTRSLL